MWISSKGEKNESTPGNGQLQMLKWGALEVVNTSEYMKGSGNWAVGKQKIDLWAKDKSSELSSGQF